MSMKENVFLLFLWQAIVVTHEQCLELERPKSRFSPTSEGTRLSSVYHTDFLWDTNIVTVSFINGDCSQRSEVRMIASEWTPYSNIDFIFIDQPNKGDIRVSFNEGLGSWSHLGMDSKSISGASMNLDWKWKGRSTILHEFGRKWEHLNFLTQLLKFCFIFQIKMLWDWATNIKIHLEE